MNILYESRCVLTTKNNIYPKGYKANSKEWADIFYLSEWEFQEHLVRGFFVNLLILVPENSDPVSLDIELMLNRHKEVSESSGKPYIDLFGNEVQ